MQLTCACIVRITAGDYRNPARAAGTGCQKSIVKFHPLCCHPVDIGSNYFIVSVTTQVVTANIIAYDKNDIASNTWAEIAIAGLSLKSGIGL